MQGRVYTNMLNASNSVRLRRSFVFWTLGYPYLIKRDYRVREQNIKQLKHINSLSTTSSFDFCE